MLILSEDCYLLVSYVILLKSSNLLGLSAFLKQGGGPCRSGGVGSAVLWGRCETLRAGRALRSFLVVMISEFQVEVFS